MLIISLKALSGFSFEWDKLCSLWRRSLSFIYNLDEWQSSSASVSNVIVFSIKRIQNKYLINTIILNVAETSPTSVE